MWYCLLGIFLLYCIANAVATLHPPENLSGEVILCGRIVKKEVKNGRMLLYLKGASICSVSADYSKKTDSGEKTKENSLKEFTNKSTNTTEYEDGKAPFGDDLKRLRNRGVVCYVPDYRDGMDFEDAYVIGKKVYLAGGISLMNEATNPGEFDAAKYYRARGYYYTLYNAEIVKTNFGVTGKDANIGEGNRSTVGNAKVVGVSTWRNSRNIGLPELLYRLRRKCSSKLCAYLGEEYGGIVSAMLFGEKENLSEDTKELFRDGGISHILAISGLHISIIGAFLYAILTFFPLPKKASFILTVGILILYGIMVGFAPSVFRAVFMFAYRLLAKNLKKAYDPPTALALSAFCTCLFFPFMAMDSSFLLTYLAFFGIVFVYPNLVSVKNGKKKWVEGLYVSFSVFAATLPVILRSYASVSLAGFLLNMLVIPAMPVLFVCSFALTFFSFVFPRGAGIFTILTRNILFAVEYVAGLVNRVSFLHLCVKTPEVGRMLIYTTFVVVLCLVSAWVKRKMKLARYDTLNRIVTVRDSGGSRRGKHTAEQEEKNKENRKEIQSGEAQETEEKLQTELLGIMVSDGVRRISFFAVMTLCIVFLMSSPKRACITFLDVGQGDGIFIRTEGGKVFMVDGGSTTKKKTGEKIIVPYLQYEGEKEVDLWFLTHEDADHINGVEEVLEQGEITVRAIALPVIAKDDENEFWKVKHLAKEKGISVLYLKAGDVIHSGDEGRAKGPKSLKDSSDYRFTILSPSNGETYADRNDASFVILYEAIDRRGTTDVYLMGDSTQAGEEAVEMFGRRSGEAFLMESDRFETVESVLEDNLKIKKNQTIVILKCAHHGSANDSNSERFIRFLSPDYAVISCGRDNLYGHPHRETVERLRSVEAAMLRTDRQGAVTFYTKKRRWKCFLSSAG